MNGAFIEVPAGGRTWRLHRPADLETLWNTMGTDEFGDDERLPYWVELWPASLGLAALLQENAAAIQGKLCLDLGCGLGLTALVGASHGARVLGMDYEAPALHYAAINARENNVQGVAWVAGDWRYPPVVQHGFDVLWGGDIMYEARFVGPVFRFLEHALAPGGWAWVAEPGRNIFPAFQQALAHGGWQAGRVAKHTVPAMHGKGSVGVDLWRISRK